MISSSLLNEGYLQPAGDLSKTAVDGTAENPFLDNPDAFYYFVSEKLPIYSSGNGDCPGEILGVDFSSYPHVLKKDPALHRVLRCS